MNDSESRRRLDDALVARGLAPSRSRARDAVRRGHVAVDGRTVLRPGARIGPAAEIAIDDPALRWVSRAALKLVAALDAFALDPSGRVALDLGASTGGFTQLLLARGARCVHSVDVGHDQFDAALAGDERVVLLEGLNVRDLAIEHLGRAPEAIVADLSFISLKQALPPALSLAAPDAWLVTLVKPQFEVGREALGKGGVVRDEARARAAADDIAGWLEGRGWRVLGIFPSPIHGGSGNAEYLLGAIHG